MDERDTIAALAALAQPTRLKVFRRLVKAGPAGLPAGDIAEREGVPHNTMSTHLGILARAGLATWRRDGRSITYAADLEGTRRLLSFLVADCCNGHPEICAPLADIIDGACAPPKDAKRAIRRKVTA
jgi:DNA-binding transcriptional ArsR family regulator